ncbi:hypothetical protein L6452_30812 [Arctium lappa]|uniref:Uncharacterized protein n=1 Tax=Arctium lappa TaxID=4217 RepID=A0ACB8ZJ77_ARCLA|nr:hypothetical protein L6452_30812 [Arctium lappa]
MPSGPKRRKAAKKKQVKQSNNSNSSSTTHSHHGESDGGELSSPAAQDQHNHQVPFTDVEVEKNEANLYQNESITVESTEKAGKEEEGNTENDDESKLSKSRNSSSSSMSSSVDDESNVFEKKVVELESAPVVESRHSIESFPEKIAHQVKDSGVETSSVLDPIKPADSLLEAESDGTQIEKLVPKSLFSEQMFVVNGSASKDNCLASSEVGESGVVENGAAKLPSLEENASFEARDDDVAVSTHPIGSVSGVKGEDCVNEPETSQYSDKQPLVASAPRAVQTTSWKGCCGILELFSSSDRN